MKKIQSVLLKIQHKTSVLFAIMAILFQAIAIGAFPSFAYSQEDTVAPPVEHTVSQEEIIVPVLEEQSAAPSTPMISPVLSTDKEDYHPGSTVTIFGKLFSPLQNFILKIFGSDFDNNNYVESVQTVSTDETGSFTATYILDPLFRPFYEMTASAVDGTVLAQGMFRDSAVGAYDQCSNDTGTGYSTGDMGCRWTNGNLNASNSLYQEGDSTVQRLWINGLIPGSTHTITFQYGTTKAGKHAYDYLTTWNASENWLTEADRCQDITGCVGTSETTAAIPQDPNVPDTFETANPRNFVIRGGTITTVSSPALTSGTYLGDSETDVSVTFTVPASGSMCQTKGNVTSCGVAIWFGAHVARTTNWQSVDGTTGAGSISGSPYHVSLESLDGGSVGQRDNQMAASALVTPSTITIHKVTNPPTDTTTSFSFTTTGTGYGAFSLTGGSQDVQNVGPGSYSVTEIVPSGWGNTGLTCTATGTGSSATPNLNNHSVAITVGSGGGATIDCTYTNTLQQAHLTLVKAVTNNNGGQATPSSWTLSATGPTPISGITGDAAITNAAVNAGVYNLAESGGPTGYSAGSWSCTAGTLNGSALTLAAGTTATCTIVNDDQPAQLTVIKHVVNNNGGNLTAGNFTLNVTASNPSQTSFVGSESGTIISLDAGSYSVDETAVSGYTKTLGANCSGTIAPGESKTCTITNDDNPATLTLVKTVTNDNGGQATASSFQAAIDGNNVSWSTAIPVQPGVHTASEINISGYTAGTWGGDCAANGGVTVGLGENKTCTITNDDQPGILHVVKVINNNSSGITATPDQFSFSVNASNPVSFETDGQNDMTVNAGTYTVTESAHAGYSTTYSNCSNVLIPNGGEATCTITNAAIDPLLTVIKVVDNGNTGATFTAGDFQMLVNGNPTPQNTARDLAVGSYSVTETGPSGYTAVYSGDCDQQGNVSLALGDNKTCTITNTAVAPTLTLVKTVINNNGGNKQVSDFLLTIDGTAVVSGNEVTSTVGAHTASEVNLPGYAASGWGGNCAADGSVTLALGDHKTCTITNDDIAPQLTVIKHVLNDNGGTAVASNWIMDVTATNPSANHFAGTEIGQTITLDAGSYSVDESGEVNGYEKTLGANCSGTIAPGESKICTITNNDIAPKLTVTKVVVNDNGGNKQISDFPLFIDSTSVTSGVENVVSAGAHTVSETADAAYVGSITGDCAANGSITLAPGDVKQCTITNNDKAPSLTLVKSVKNDNGGTAVASSWTLSAVGPTPISGTGGATSNTTFEAGTYTLSESTGPAGYSAGAWSCTGIANTGDQITLGLGQSATCTIINDDIAPQLTVIKHVINDNGDTASASDFTMSVTGTGVSTPTFPGSEAGVTMTLTAGSYSVDEVSSAGYNKTLGANCSGTIGVGETKTCIITNDDIPHPTRTQGFWQTHTSYTNQVFASLGTLTIGGHTINTQSKLFSGFYSSIPKLSDGKAKRSALDQARMQMLQQWLAAQLNCKAFGCSLTTQTLLSNAATAWAGTNVNLIKSYAGQLDTYNNSNDALPIATQGKATPKDSQSFANGALSFWDILP